MIVRPFEPGCEAALWNVFHSSVHRLATREYTPAERIAWAPHVLDAALEARWIERMRRIRPYAVVVDDAIAAYGDLQDDGLIDHIYVAGTFGARGVGTFLMHHLLDRAVERGLATVTSHVSRTAQGFFERFGFVVVERRVVPTRGALLANAHMRLALAGVGVR